MKHVIKPHCSRDGFEKRERQPIDTPAVRFMTEDGDLQQGFEVRMNEQGQLVISTVTNMGFVQLHLIPSCANMIAIGAVDERGNPYRGPDDRKK